MVSFWYTCSKCNAPTQKHYNVYILYVATNGNGSFLINQKEEENYMSGKSGI